MLTSSTAKSSTLCADYEIGLQLEPQARNGRGIYGMAVESIEAPGHSRIEYRFHASTNMLAMYDQGIRRGGETAIDGIFNIPEGDGPDAEGVPSEP